MLAPSVDAIDQREKARRNDDASKTYRDSCTVDSLIEVVEQ